MVDLEMATTAPQEKLTIFNASMKFVIEVEIHSIDTKIN